MRKLICALTFALLIALTVFPASAQDAKGITAYKEVIDLANDGSAQVTTSFTLVGWDSDKLDLPLNVASADNLVVEAQGCKAAAASGKTGDVKVIKLQFDGKPPAQSNIMVRYTAKGFLDFAKAVNPRGIVNLSYTFTNATSANIGKYDFKVLLPPGYAMNGVSSSTPRATGEEVEPPYDFANEGGRVAVSLHSPSVGVGKNAAIAFGFQKSDLSALPVIVIGILIIVAALVYKRDVLTRPDFEKPVAS
jgi:hypothetical protein